MTGVFVYEYRNGNRNDFDKSNSNILTIGEAGESSIILSPFPFLLLIAWYPSAPLLCVQELMLHGVPFNQVNYIVEPHYQYFCNIILDAASRILKSSD